MDKQKKLVAYFSCSGVTARAAKAVAEAAGADLYEIVPERPYTDADLNWMDKNSRNTLEMRDGTSRPAIAGRVENMEEYGVVFIGFPIWWYVAPRIVETFLESYDFSGKTIILFATSGGSGLGKTASDLTGCCPGAVIKEGQMLNGHYSKDTLKQWAENL